MPAPSRLRARLASMARDLRTVLLELRGDHPSPLVARRPGPRPEVAVGALPSATTAAARPLRVRALHRETQDALTIVLGDPTGAPIRFVPGQFLTLLVTIDGETHRRAYSICSSIDEPDTVAVTVKRLAGGRVSTHLHERLAPGDVVPVLGPSGDFTVAPDPAARRALVLIAGGSGITPIMAITRAVLAREPDSRVTLIAGNRAAPDIIFRADLDALLARHPGRLVVRHVLERTEGDAVAATVGRLDRVTVAAELAAVADRIDADSHVYVCGPAPAMAEVREALAARGVPAAQVHEERFATAERAAGVRAAQRLVLARPGGAAVDVVVPPGGTILDAGLAAGVAMDFSCAMGGCGACAVQLTAGEVDLDEPNCLSPEERAGGRILACVARPRSACTAEVPR